MTRAILLPAILLFAAPASADVSLVAEPSPGRERGVVVTAGATVGLLASSLGGGLVAAIAYPTLACEACGYDALYTTLAAVPVAALLTIPASVFLFGNLSGRGADFGWTLLGGLLGALPGAALLAAGAGVDEANSLDPGLFYAGGGLLAALGVITGSIVAFELSSGPSPVTVEPGLGSVTVRGRF